MNSVSLEVGAVGALVDHGDGSWTYTPPVNWSGDLSLTYNVTDGNVDVPTSASITVDAINYAATVGDDGIAEITAGNLHARDVEDEADEIVYTLLEGPEYGEVELNGMVLEEYGTFTQQDIDDGLLKYVRDTGAVETTTMTAGEGGDWSDVDLYAFDNGTSYVDGAGHFDPSAADAQVYTGHGGAGVRSGDESRRSKDIDHDADTGTSEALAIDFKGEVLSAEVDFSSMSGGGSCAEGGYYEAFDADGNRVGEKVEMDSSNLDYGRHDTASIEIQFTDNAGDPVAFQTLVFTAGPKAHGGESDFYVQSVKFEKIDGPPEDDNFLFTAFDSDDDAEDEGEPEHIQEDAGDGYQVTEDGHSTFNINLDPSTGA